MTVPAKSRPGVLGKVVEGKEPFELRMSEGRMGDECVFRRTSPGPGVGV